MEAVTIDDEIARSIRRQGTLTSKEYEETQRQALQCWCHEVEIAEITHTFPRKHDRWRVVFN